MREGDVGGIAEAAICWEALLDALVEVSRGEDRGLGEGGNELRSGAMVSRFISRIAFLGNVKLVSLSLRMEQSLQSRSSLLVRRVDKTQVQLKSLIREVQRVQGSPGFKISRRVAVVSLVCITRLEDVLRVRGKVLRKTP